MALKLNDLIFKTDSSTGKKQLTTGAKVGAGVLAGGAAFLLSKIKAKQQQKKNDSAQTQVALSETTTITDVPVAPTEKPKSNTMLYVGLGVGAVLIIGAVLLVTKKKA